MIKIMLSKESRSLSGKARCHNGRSPGIWVSAVEQPRLWHTENERNMSRLPENKRLFGSNLPVIRNVVLTAEVGSNCRVWRANSLRYNSLRIHSLRWETDGTPVQKHL